MCTCLPAWLLCASCRTVELPGSLTVFDSGVYARLHPASDNFSISGSSSSQPASQSACQPASLVWFAVESDWLASQSVVMCKLDKNNTTLAYANPHEELHAHIAIIAHTASQT